MVAIATSFLIRADSLLDIPSGAGEEIGAFDIDETGVVVSFGGLTDATSSVRRMAANGVTSWSTAVAGTVFQIGIHHARTIVEMSNPAKLVVLRSADGSPLTQFASFSRANDLRVSPNGDAIVSFKSSFRAGAGNFVDVTSVDTGQVRHLTVPAPVGTAAAVDPDRILVLTTDGVLELWQGSVRLWAQQVGFDDLELLTLSRDGSRVLVKLPLGECKVVDVQTGRIVFSYATNNPESALALLGVRDLAIAQLQAGLIRRPNDAAVTLLNIAASYSPSFADGGLVLRPPDWALDLPFVRVDLSDGTTSLRTTFRAVREKLSHGSTQLSAAVQAADRLEVRHQGGRTAVKLPGHVVILGD